MTPVNYLDAVFKKSLIRKRSKKKSALMRLRDRCTALMQKRRSIVGFTLSEGSVSSLGGRWINSLWWWSLTHGKWSDTKFWGCVAKEVNNSTPYTHAKLQRIYWTTDFKFKNIEYEYKPFNNTPKMQHYSTVPRKHSEGHFPHKWLRTSFEHFNSSGAAEFWCRYW